MAYTVLTNTQLSPQIQALLTPTCDVHIWPVDSTDPVVLLQAAEGFFLYGHPKITAAVMDRMPRLRVISNFGVGIDHVDLAAARQRGIAVGTTPHLVDGATADMTFALLLAVARNLVVSDRYARSAMFVRYDPNLWHGHDIFGATLGIVGLGNIGRQVARRAQGFDMRILYHNRKPDPAAEAALGVTYRTLPALLQEADFVTLNVPMSPETRHLIGRAQLAQMKPSAYLINVARGGVVDHDALYDALRTGQIAGAAVDVTEPEPLPRDHPLLGLDNLVIAPHLGSATKQTRQAMAQLTVDNLMAGLTGQPLPSPVA